MKNLWTPWRYKYITSAKSRKCILCKASTEKNPKDSLVLFRGKKVFILLNRYPYTNGHLMIAPYEHASSPEDSSEDLIEEIARLIQVSIKVIRKAYKPDGFNAGINIGLAGGAGIEDHYHFHIVPRWKGDTNFMAVINDVRIIPQTLEEVWDLLAPEFAKYEEKKELVM